MEEIIQIFPRFRKGSYSTQVTGALPWPPRKHLGRWAVPGVPAAPEKDRGRSAPHGPHQTPGTTAAGPALSRAELNSNLYVCLCE